MASAAGTGHVSLALGFVNDGRHACSLRGWPVVTAVPDRDRRGAAQRVGNAFLGFTHVETRAVVLRPGKADDAFVIAGIDNPVQGRSCGPPYRRVDVALAGQPGRLSFSAFVPYLGTYMPACSRLIVTSVQARSSLGF